MGCLVAIMEFAVTIDRENMTYAVLGAAGGYQTMNHDDLAVQIAHILGRSGTNNVRIDTEAKTVEVVDGSI